MNKYRSRLLFAVITVIIIVLVSLGIALGHLFKNVYHKHFNERMLKEVQLAAHFIEHIGIPKEEVATKELQSMLQLLDMRIGLLNGSEGMVYTNSSVLEEAITDSVNLADVLQRAKKAPGEVQRLSLGKGSYYYVVHLNDFVGNEGYLVVNASIDSIEEIMEQLWFTLMISLGFALIIIVIFVVKITGKYVKPIESITDVAIELANGNYKARTYEAPVDEVGMLSEAINILARNLQVMKTNDEMQRDRLHTLIENVGSAIILIDGKGYITLTNKVYKEWFEIDTTEHVHQLFYEAIPSKKVIQLVEDVLLSEKTVRKQFVLSTKMDRRDFDVYGAPIIGNNHEWKGILVVFHDIYELKKLEQIRKDFVANVSHELRTPITSIKGFSETLLDGAMEDEQLRQYFLSIILKESERLQSLVEDLLELSKMEKMGFELNIEEIHGMELLEEIHVLLQKKAEKKQLSFYIEAEKDVIIHGDPYRLKQVLLNIVNNAILYTPEYGTVTIRMKESRKNIHITVRDTGVGMGKEEIPRIFERFYRVDRARSRESGGTGLGLAIVKHLVEAHHGYVKVESEVGKGTSMTVILPKK